MKFNLSIEQDGPIWDENTCFDISDQRFESIALPENDLANVQFDRESGVTENVFTIFSSPRSGSTALCDYLNKCGICIPHEYFQPFQYMPTLAKRWGAHEKGILNPRLYTEKLCGKRTQKNGVLGLNVHGAHLDIFKYFLSYFPKDIRYRGLVLKRRDKVAQAVSYYLASETKVWSSHFKGEASPAYSFEKIKSKLQNILSQEVLIDKYTAHLEYPVTVMFYEDLCVNAETIQYEVGKKSKSVAIDLARASIKKQSKSVNEQYSLKFKREMGL